MGFTDKERLDFLEKLTEESKYTGKVILRSSVTGRGWRLHETAKDGDSSVRNAIDKVMKKAEKVRNIRV